MIANEPRSVLRWVDMRLPRGAATPTRVGQLLNSHVMLYAQQVSTYIVNKTYSLRNTRIGNSNGFRLPVEFYRDNPQCRLIAKVRWVGSPPST